MNTKQMLEDFWKDVLEVSPSDINNETICIVTDDNMKDYTRKLIESVAEEIIGEDNDSYIDHWGQYHNVITDSQRSQNKLRAEQRLKVKEIINSLEK